MFLFVFSLFYFFCGCFAHSLLSDPRPTSPKACRLGGDPSNGGLIACPGPCDVSSLQPGFPVVTSPSMPAANYSRGQTVTIKYQRNNHPPGGFVRLSIVPVSKMMDKQVHASNAFHYSCWGGHPVIAKESDMVQDRLGFSISGGDGKFHGLKPAYYTTTVIIPNVIPDGNYVLGWVWYGGLDGTLEGLEKSIGLYADYWSCSFIRISGGEQLQSEFQPTFTNNLKNRWEDGCLAANDRPGNCVFEPCVRNATVQIPWEFKEGNGNNTLRPEMFTSGNDVVPTPVPAEDVIAKAMTAIFDCKKGSIGCIGDTTNA